MWWSKENERKWQELQEQIWIAEDWEHSERVAELKREQEAIEAVCRASKPPPLTDAERLQIERSEIW